MSHTIRLLPFDQYTPSSIATAITKVASTPFSPPLASTLAFARGEVSRSSKSPSLDPPSNSTSSAEAGPRPAQRSNGPATGPALPGEQQSGGGIIRAPRDATPVPAVVSKSLLQADPLVADIVCIRSTFKFRVLNGFKGKGGIGEVYAAPDCRPTFQQMLWTILVFSRNMNPSHETIVYVASPSPSPSPSPSLANSTTVPLIRPIPMQSAEPVTTESTYRHTIHLVVFMLHTESLLHLFPLPSNLLNRLSEIATRVDGNLFARYMGTRSPWRLSNRMGQAAYGWVFVLLEWWAATSPACLRDYQSAIVVLKRTMPGREGVQSGLKRGCAGRLKKELRAAIGRGQMSEVEERRVLIEGFEFIARIRREMFVVLWEAYEVLVGEARMGGDVFWTKGDDDVSYLGRERYALFKQMMGRDVESGNLAREAGGRDPHK